MRVLYSDGPRQSQAASWKSISFQRCFPGKAPASNCPHIGALMITYTILGAHYYNYSIISIIYPPAP